MGAEFGMYSFAGYSELRMCLGSGQSAQRPRLTVLLFNMPNEHVKFYCYCYERMLSACFTDADTSYHFMNSGQIAHIHSIKAASNTFTHTKV